MVKKSTDKFSIELFDTICTAIATSSIGLRHLCKENNVTASAFYEWIKKDQVLLDKYTRAREDQADFLADEIIEIADDGSNDFMTIVKGHETYEVENKEWTSRSKLRVEARKWVAAKLKPRKYGDKLDVTSDGEKIHSYNIGFKKPDEG